MGPLDKQNLRKSQTSKKVKAANVPMKNISQKTMVTLSRSVNTPIFQIGKIISYSSKNWSGESFQRTCQLFRISDVLSWVIIAIAVNAGNACWDWTSIGIWMTIYHPASNGEEFQQFTDACIFKREKPRRAYNSTNQIFLVLFFSLYQFHSSCMQMSWWLLK